MSYTKAQLVGGPRHGEYVTFDEEITDEKDLPSGFGLISKLKPKPKVRSNSEVNDIYDFMGIDYTENLPYYHYSRTDIVEDVPPPSRH